MGSLLPTEGVPPRYAQLYFFDIQNEIRNRMSALMEKETTEKVDENTVSGLIQMLDRSNVLAQSFRMVKEWCRSHGSQDFSLRLISERTTSRQYNVLTMSEVAAMVVNDFGDGIPSRDIVERFKCMTPDEINDIIAAELPSPTKDPDGYKVVSEFMLHGPYGKDAKYAPCTIEGKCSKHYPKVFLEETMIDEDGYPIYRGRNNKVIAKKGKFTYNNQHAVPCNWYLLLKYLAHINVEWCNRSKAIKYLFKYLNKGPDRAAIVIQENLNYHLPNQNAVTLRDSKDLPTFMEKEGINITIFTDWFELNKRDPAARGYTYVEIPQHYVWHAQHKIWRPMKQKKCIVRIVYSSPASGERYYLRMLLNVVRGAQSFEKLMTVNKQTYAKVKVACFTYGLLNDDKEWSHAISEAKFWAMGP
ncbi:hypothetical protein Tco_1292364 [Tanacetum coccineum]